MGGAAETGDGVQAFKMLGEYLEAEGWHPQEVEGKSAYYFGYSGKLFFINAYALVRTELEQLLCYATVADRVPESLRPVMAEFIARANYGLRLGNFELDYADGEVRFRNGLNFNGVTLNAALIRNVLYPTVETFDHYLPGVMAVIFEGKSAVDAIAIVEGQ